MLSGVLQVTNLSIDRVSQQNKFIPVVRDVSFTIEPATIIGLFGESGCGKTTLALALLNLLPPEQYRVQGSVLLEGRNLLALNEQQLERVRGAAISMVFQDPLLALNPVLRVGDQVAEVIRGHCARRTAQEDCPTALLRMVGLEESRVLHAYPHQLSGGERQRVALAQALACHPAVVIGDEPFTALDAIRVLELASLFRELRGQLRTAFLIISHSAGVLNLLADQVLRMEAGTIVERGTPQQVFHGAPAC